MDSAATLKFASCMAEHTEFVCRGVARYVGAKLGCETEYVNDVPWQERERRFDSGEIQILWLCGLPYVYKMARPDPGMELLAVPVPSGRRYAAMPVYYSDVVVREDSPFRAFADLRGKAWAINEPRSHSGYNVVRAHLAMLGERTGFFARVVESGAHVQSLRLILDRRIDGAAIDSTVLEWIVEQRPKIAGRIRVIDTLGPSPIPPWVVSKSLPHGLRRRIRKLLLGMHGDARGAAVLRRGRILKFVAGEDDDYEPIRTTDRAAQTVAMARS